MGINLPLVSIQAAEELERLRLKKGDNIEKTRELSNFMKEKFDKRLDYSLIFTKAYFSVYNPEIGAFTLKNSKKHIKEISEKLNNLDSLKNKEIAELVSFCVSLSDYSSLHEESIQYLKGPCFG